MYSNLDLQVGIDDDEVFIEGNDADDVLFKDDVDNDFIDNLHLIENIEYCQPIFPFINFDYISATNITFHILGSFLPKSFLHVNDFDKHPVLCEISIETKNSWTQQPQSVSITNPIFKNNFVGKSLMMKHIKSFFSNSYKSSPFYHCQNYIVAPQAKIDDYKLARLLEMGYEFEDSKRALQICFNSLEESINYLNVGIISNGIKTIDVDYSEYPLFYLMMEIIEVFFKLSDHCCICEQPLEVTGIKPMVCTNKMCNFSFVEIGVGANIIGEIRRDPVANDLLISLASTTYTTKYFDPKPPDFSILDFTNFFNNLPPMKNLVSHCRNDIELQKYLGKNKMFQILKFLILANKSHMITLDRPEIQIKECNNSTTQFLLTMASPEFERQFQNKKKKYGSMYLWHGSNVVRWYSILHNGLKDLGRTVDRVHSGPIYGDGIYQSNLSSYSLPYCYCGLNQYRNSTLPKNLQVLSMTENALTPGCLNNPIQYEYTQTDERACIIRSLMVVNQQFSWDIVQNPPKHIPSLDDVLKVLSKK